MRNDLRTTGLLIPVLALTLAASAERLGAQAIAPTADRQSDPSAFAVVEQYLKAIGGRDVLGKIKSRMSKFRNIKYSATGETVANIAFYMMEGYKYREEWDIEGFKIQDKKLAFVQIYNGDLLEGWVSMFGTVSALEGRTLEVFVWDKYLDDFFMHWEEDGYTLKHVGQGLVNGEHPADILESIDFAGRQTIRYFFSKENGLLLKKEWQDFSQKEVAKKEQYYKRYKRIAFSDGSGLGIMFPLTVEILIDGDLDTERVYQMVKFNSGLSDKLFERPEGKEFTQAIAESRDKGGIFGPDTDAPPAAADADAGAVKTKAEGSASRVQKREGSASRRKVTSPPPTTKEEPKKPTP